MPASRTEAVASVTLAPSLSTSSTARYGCSTSPSSTSIAGLLPGDGSHTHQEKATPEQVELSARNRGHCRPPTGAASQNCQPPTGATVSSINRDRTASTQALCVHSAYINAGGPPDPKIERASDLLTYM